MKTYREHIKQTETIKRKSERNYYSQKILEYKKIAKNMDYYEGGNRQKK